jgi:thiamine biosynthesis protein ThiS
MTELYIQLNNHPYPYVEGATVNSLMAENNFNFATIIVKINGVVIEEDKWMTEAVNAGDNVEIIHIFGGG